MKGLPGLSLVGLALALSSSTVLAAEPPLPAGTGQVVGEVAVCNNSSEFPAPNVAVGVDGGQLDMARTDTRGQFSIALAPGEYTIVATADDGSTASRFEVPVTEGETLDIGIIDLHAGIAGCGFDTDLPAVPLISPTPTPTATTSAPPDGA